MSARVAVVGLGPAGRAVAHRLSARGLDVVAVDPAPHRPWYPTYAAWTDEIPSWLPAAAVRTSTPARAWALKEHELGRRYSVFDTTGLQEALTLPPAQTLTGRAVEIDRHRVTVADGRVIEADVVIDARGSRPHPDRAQQTAAGVVLPRSAGVALHHTWFMDWRPDNGAAATAPASFLYVVPLDDDLVLAEETCLVGRPALAPDELRRRLHVRLAARGVRLSGQERQETVRFSVQPPPLPATEGPGRPGPLRIGARGGLMHAATGYSVCTSLHVAERLSVAIAAGADPQEMGDVIWPTAERRVQRLRQAGLDTLLALRPDQTVRFFEAFFRLPVGLQTAYLSRRDRPAATLTAMAAMVGTLPPSLTRIAVSRTLARRPVDGLTVR